VPSALASKFLYLNSLLKALLSVLSVALSAGDQISVRHHFKPAKPMNDTSAFLLSASSHSTQVLLLFSSRYLVVSHFSGYFETAAPLALGEKK